MRARLAVVLSLLVTAGCPSQPTTVLLSIVAGEGVGQLDALQLSVYTDTGAAVSNARLPEEGEPSLPDEVVLYPPQSSGQLRILVSGLNAGSVTAQGTTLVVLKPGEQAHATVVIESGRLPDADKDGVPDAVDNCPAVPNPDQGPCGGPDGGGDGPSPPDGPVPDLIPAPDLFPVPDLRPDFPQVACTSNTDCDDSDACTTEQCNDGQCHYEVVVCPQPTEQCKMSACDKVQGCQVVNAPDGAKCDDDKYCTVGDACAGGVCVTQPRDCNASAPTCSTGTCNEDKDACDYSAVSAGTSCDDGDTCTQGEACDSNGSCVAPGPQTETVAPAAMVDETDRSIVVDSQGHVHIVYYTDVSKELRHATNATGSWVVSTVDTGGNGRWPALAIDDQDGLHVVYADSGANQMRYAKTGSGGNWNTATIGPGSGHSGIAVSGGKVHASFVEDDALWYAENSSGTWTATQVEALPSASLFDSAGYYSSLALESGKVHIAHAWVQTSLSVASGKLRHTTNAGGTWSGEDAAPSLTVPHGATCSLAIDSTGTLLISHYTPVGQAPLKAGLHLSSRAKGAAGWQTQTLLNGSVGSFSSILVSNQDAIHIAYRHYGANELHHVTKASGSWQETVVDTDGDTGRWASMVQGPSGQLHFAYEKQSAFELRHATLSACP